MDGPPEPARAPGEESQTEFVRRASLRRDLRRANTAWAVVLLAIVGLAIGLVGKARQAARDAREARRNLGEARRQAERANAEAARAEAELWKARFAEARALRLAGGPGARTQASALLEQLARAPLLTETQRLQLRTESLALLPLVDVRAPSAWVTQAVVFNQNWDRSMRRYVQSFETNRVEIREHPAGSVVAALEGPAGFVRHEGRFSRDGRFFATLWVDATEQHREVWCWSVADGRRVLARRTTGLHWRDVPVFTPDSRSLGVYTTRGLELHRLDGEEPPVVLPRRPALAFSPDSRWAALGEGRTVEVWWVEEARKLGGRDVGWPVACLDWSPDGGRVVAGGEAGQLALWEFSPDTWSRRAAGLAGEASGGVGWVRPLEGHREAVVGAGFSPDGALVLSGGWDGFSSFWEVRTGRRLLAESRWNLEGFSGDGSAALARVPGNFSQGPAGVLARTGFRTVAYAASGGTVPSGMRFSPDGRWLATEHGLETRLWDAVTGLPRGRIGGRSAVFLAGERQLITVSNRTVWRWIWAGNAGADDEGAPTGREIHREPDPGAVFNSVSLASDGRTLVVAGTEAGVILVDAGGERPVRRLERPAHFADLASDGEWLVSQMHNREAWLVHRTNLAGPRLLGGHLNLAFSPSGQYLGAATVKSMVLLRRHPEHTNGWSRVFTHPLEIGTGALAPFAFSPDERRLAVVDHRREIRLLEIPGGRELATLTPPFPAQIRGRDVLAFSADGRFLRALRDDGEVVEWDLPAVRSELARLGLDWESPATEVQLASATEVGTDRGLAGEAPVDADVAADRWPWAAVAGGGLALAAGLGLFLHQRRVLAAYARAEARAAEQQRQLTEAQRALFEGQKLEALGTLAAGVAHDFNNLLSVIRMSAQLVKRAIRPEGATRENLEAVERAVAQGKSIVNSMLAYSRRPVEVGGRFPVEPALRNTVALLSRQFLSGLELRMQIPPGLPPVHGSAARFEQVLLNLILNAAEAMRGGGVLSLSAGTASGAPASVLAPRPSEAYVEVSVEDTGPGIAPEILPRIFEPFFTTKNTGARRGTGLGLSLVYTIARQDGWGVDVESSPGRGTRFRILLPVAPGENDGRGLPTSPSGPARANLPGAPEAPLSS